MSAYIPQTDIPVRWLSEPDSEPLPDPVLHGWLTGSGLLTARIKSVCSDSFRLDVLPPPNAGSPSGSLELIREVVLSCGDTPCIYAETRIPGITLEQHSWLGSLGNEPLGESLETRSHFSRSNFEYALLDPSLLPQAVPIAQPVALWARRSDFFSGETSLTVTEIFLPGILKCERKRANIAD